MVDWTSDVIYFLQEMIRYEKNIEINEKNKHVNPLNF